MTRLWLGMPFVVTRFDETGRPDLDPDDDDTPAADVAGNVVDPNKLINTAEKPYGGDDDIASGQYGRTADCGDD
jgi:hypothetical protein